jgi:hypothetical protein
MKIPRARQDAHIAGMADFLGRIFRMVAAVVVERLNQGRPSRHWRFSAKRVVGKSHQIAGAVE